MVEAQQAPKTGEVNVLVGKANEFLQDVVGAPIRYLANWGRLYSLWPVHLETACCVPPDTIVLGDNKQISDYKLNDKVTGVTGLVDVVKTFTREHRGKIVKVTGRGMLPFLVTPEHPILTVRGRLPGGRRSHPAERQWTNAGDLRAPPTLKKDGGLLSQSGTYDCLLIPRTKGFVDSTSIPLVSDATRDGPNTANGRGSSPPPEFPLTKDTAWLLGVYVADGRATDDHDVHYSLEHEAAGLAKRVCAISESFGYAPRMKGSGTATEVGFSSAIMARALRDWCGHLAENKKVPDFILYHNDAGILEAFLEGYLRRGGSDIGDKGGQWHMRAETSSKVLALQLQLACARLGRFAAISRTAARGVQNIPGGTAVTRDSYTVSVLQSRETSDAEVTDDFIAVPITGVELVDYSGLVSNLETGDNTYLVSNAVVHNCSVEVGATAGSRFDAERFGVLEAFGSLRQCDLIIVMGTVTRKLAPRLKLIYDQMAEPKWVIAMGACLRGDSLVYTPNGPLEIDSLAPGDLVYSYDEVRRRVASSRVVARKETGVRESYRVRAGSYEVVGTDNHRFAVYSKAISRKWVAYETMRAMREEGFSAEEVAPLLGVSSRTMAYWNSHPPARLGLDLVWKHLAELEEGDLLCTFAEQVPGVSRPAAYSAPLVRADQGTAVQRVSDISPRGEEMVYDIEVEGYHNFFANGQLVHNCSITGGLYFDSYNVLRGIDDIIPVDVYVPGCPPRAESLMQGVALLQDKIRHSNSLSGR